MRKHIGGLLVAALSLASAASPALADQFDSFTMTPPLKTNTGVGSTASVAVNLATVRMAREAIWVLTDNSLAGGTLDCKLQVSNDGTNWADLPSGAFAQLTASGSKAIRLAGPFGYQLRYYLTNGATVSASAPTVKMFLHY